MKEIGNFAAFSKPKQLFAYFGLDPAVKQSGKFEGTKIKISNVALPLPDVSYMQWLCKALAPAVQVKRRTWFLEITT